MSLLNRPPQHSDDGNPLLLPHPINLVQAATSSRKRKATEPAPMTLPRPLSNPPLVSYNAMYIDQASGVPVLGGQGGDPAETPRKRAVVACEVCRNRKSKCDGAKPKCQPCQDRNQECIYRDPGVKMDAGDRMILARLNQLESYLRLRLDGQSDGPYDDAAPSMNNDDLAGNGNRPEVNLRLEECAFNPFELPQVKEVFSHTLHPQQLLDEELAREAFHVGDSLSLELHENPAIVQAFFDTINIWYACVNPATWPVTYQTAASGHFREGPESCLVLLVLALGKAGTAGDSSSSHEAAGMQYFSAAWSLIPSLVINQSLISLQCIVLASVYLLYLSRPVEAWTLLSSITMKLQLHLANQATLAPETRKLLTRVAWNAILLESDILAELALPQSNLISHFSTLDMPSPFLSHFDSNEDDFAAALPRDDPWYLTASVYLFRLRMRISDMLYSATTPSSFNALEPLIVDLDTSLAAWSSTYQDPSASIAPAVRNWLGFRYNALRALIYRPVLHLTLSSYSLSSSSPPIGTTTNVITNGTVHTYPAAARSMLHASLDSSMYALEHFAEYSSSHFPFAWQGELAVVRCAIMVMATRDGGRPPPSSHLQQPSSSSSAAAGPPTSAATAPSNPIHSPNPNPKSGSEQQHPPALSSLLGAPDHVDAVLVAVARELRAIVARSAGLGGGAIGSALSPTRGTRPSPTSARAAAVMDEILAASLADGGIGGSSSGSNNRGGGGGVEGFR